MIIYYVGADLAPESKWLLHNHFGTIPSRPHATIIYSRKWFPYKTAKFFPLVIEPPYSLTFLRGSLVLKFENNRFFMRHIELRNLGASSDYDHFISHITICPKIPEDLTSYTTFPVEYLNSKGKVPDFPIILSNEYYGTWEEKE